MNLRIVALGAGVLMFFLALFTQGVLPLFEPPARSAKVTAVVRTDVGQLKWMVTKATDYTPLEQRGRNVYLANGCWYCHSQFVRPVTGETRRWGPVSEAGEYVYDVPHLFGTRRIGPDLTRVGLKYGNEWHYAHFWDPRQITPDSIMSSYRGLFSEPADAVAIVDADAAHFDKDEKGNVVPTRTLDKTPVTENLFDFASKELIKLTPSKDGVMFVPKAAHGKFPIVWTPNEEFAGKTVKIAAETDDLESLIAYVQKLGMNRGKWRDLFEPQQLEIMDVALPRSAEWIAHGKEVYERRCIGCHGAKGDGNGPAATFMVNQRPRNFTLGEFKFTLTGAGALPGDGDLLRTITRGVRGTAMPPWYDLPLNDRLAVIEYIKYVLAIDTATDPTKPESYFSAPPTAPLYIEQPPAPTRDIVAHGKDVWENAKCWECHGHKGVGDGEKAAGLKDNQNFPIRPANLTTGQFKSGADVQDIYRTISIGLKGTPMPAFKPALPDQDRWALSYYILSLSAFKDPLTAAPLAISATDRAGLNDVNLDAATPATAYVGHGDLEKSAAASGAAMAPSAAAAADKHP